MAGLGNNRRNQIQANLREKRGTGPKGLSGNFQAALGAQLSRRVQSGAIDQNQARKVAGQRALLAKAYGPDWRTKVFGKGGAKGISGPFARGIVAGKRNQALQRAKRKLNGGTSAY